MGNVPCVAEELALHLPMQGEVIWQYESLPSVLFSRRALASARLGSSDRPLLKMKMIPMAKAGRAACCRARGGEDLTTCVKPDLAREA